MQKFVLCFLVFLAACQAVSHKPTALTIEPTKTAAVQLVTPTPTKVQTALPPTATLTPTVISAKYYVVQSGDTITSISERLNLNPKYLIALNSLANPDLIFAGQVLKITGLLTPPPATKPTGKEIVVKLSYQMVFVYQDGSLIKMFSVSTGVSAYPTRTGDFEIYLKYPVTEMTGPGYDLKNVKWTMYFDQGRGFHAKYWNQIYGIPSSHGCVNMKEDDARWLYDWADIGTKVTVIP